MVGSRIRCRRQFHSAGALPDPGGQAAAKAGSEDAALQGRVRHGRVYSIYFYILHLRDRRDM